MKNNIKLKSTKTFLISMAFILGSFQAFGASKELDLDNYECPSVEEQLEGLSKVMKSEGFMDKSIIKQLVTIYTNKVANCYFTSTGEKALEWVASEEVKNTDNTGRLTLMRQPENQYILMYYRLMDDTETALAESIGGIGDLVTYLKADHSEMDPEMASDLKIIAPHIETFSKFANALYGQD